ncbi:hypothetical protein G195_001835 [Phytophthora kernoviae 00238/432]|uniref:Fe/B12 periplasmic-binding domain-containing protein n=1 Tax=Phytophthora kernoviae 00238/432 TaxID=1284355 RepID=A0A8J4SQQ0_9STRA|nr:hypothetical protein G195_001835 [Phytophthora kernoviae 00238/432]
MAVLHTLLGNGTPDDQIVLFDYRLPRILVTVLAGAGLGVAGAALQVALSAVSVSMAGGIGFIGLAAPHLARRLVGPMHRHLIPAAGLIAFLSHVADRLQNTTPLGPVKDPDMEALLALKPDVIYLDEEFSGDDIAKFEKIAPVHVFNLDDGTWRDHLKDIGKLVNREKEAEQYIQDYATETEEVKSLIHDTIGDGTVMAIRVTAKELRVFSTRRPMGPILYEDLGLTPAKGIEEFDSSKPYQVVSREILPDFDADAIFVVVNSDDEAQSMFKELQNNPIWQGLKAVKAGHVYPIGAQPWLDYSSIGNKMAMDEAKEMFSKK